jgi:flagellar biosynthesis/type III secretory pathway protein FliH
MMALPEVHQRRYWQAVLQLEKERNMKLLNPLEQMFMDDGMEKGLRQGLERGLEQGLEKGRREGAALVLERLLTQRFGPLPQTVRKKLTQASMEQLGAWSDALADAQSLKQVFV